MERAPLPVCLVLPVWGQRHVTRLIERVLPSWFAPGNLPALFAGRDGAIVLLAGADDLARIGAHPALARLNAIAPVRQAPIDDLIASEAPSVTLTLAFTRGAAIARQSLPDCAVAFLNADFVLADGSLRHLAARLDGGATVVLAPSLRAIESTVQPRLDAMRAPDDVLAVAPRALARLALGALHPTVTACRMDQPLLASAHPNQLFWRADDETLICRSLLLFPLAIVPSGPVGPASSFCDYDLFEQLRPEASPLVLGDSDHWFALELSPETHEHWLVRPGQLGRTALARSLSSWSTPFHRAQARHDIIVHAGEIGAQAAAARTAAERAVDELLARLGPPLPATGHPYWLSGVAAWRRLRREAGLSDSPPELGPTPSAKRSSIVFSPVARAVGGRFLIGRPGQRRFWHPGWLAERVLARVVSAGVTQDLVVLGETQILAELLAPAHLQRREPCAAARSGRRAILIGCDPSADLAPLAAEAARAVEGGGEAWLVVARAAQRQDWLGGVSGAELARIVAAFDNGFMIEQAVSIDDWADRLVRRWHRQLASDFHHRGPAGRIWLLLRSGLGLLGLAAANPLRALVPRTSAAPEAGLVMARLRRRPVAVRQPSSLD